MPWRRSEGQILGYARGVQSSRFEVALSVVLVLVAALACRGRSTTGSSKLSYGSESDVERLLATHGATVKVHDCENLRYGDAAAGTRGDPGITRALSCLTTLAPAEASALTSGFGMHPAKVPASSGPAQLGTCGARGFIIGAAGFDAFEIRGRAATPGWEYLLVVVEPATGRTCVETEYAWS